MRPFFMACVLACVVGFAATASAEDFVAPASETTPFVSPGDLTADVAGEPLPAPAPVADEDPKPLAAPPAGSGLEKKKAPAPRSAGPGAAAAPAKASSAKPAPPPALPTADLTYAVTARRATLDPAGAKLTLESVTPIVAAVRTFNGTSRAGRRSTAARFFSDDFKRNGTWLNSPAGVLYGTVTVDGKRAEASFPLRLYAASYSTASGNAVFRALQLDGPGNATITGGVSNFLLDEAADAGAELKATRKLTLQDPLLLVDALYARKDEYKGPDGFKGN